MRISEKYNWRKLSPDDGNFFFGYYDRNPWNEDNSKHLALKAPQCERLPLPGETAEAGYIEKNTGEFIKCAETRAWCHQQGAMQQWLKHLSDTFIFNDYDVRKQSLVCRVYQIGKGIIGQYDLPVYVLSPDGNWGISLNFSRIPRRGYSYADVPVPDNKHPDSDNDGLFLMDMRTGKSKLIVSYADIIEKYPIQYELAERYWWLNHPGFNCDSTKLLFLFRHCGNSQVPYPWSTNMYTVNIDGSGLNCVLPDVYWQNKISHQLWAKEPDEILLDANWRGKGSEYIVTKDVPGGTCRLISAGMGPMGHLIFSPDGGKMLADTYPQNNIQSLAIVNTENGQYEILGNFKHTMPNKYPVDVRCDLHPRWSADGSLITVDSIHSGKRQIYMLEL
jgi:hypothetical protein